MQEKPFPTKPVNSTEYYEKKYFRLNYDVIKEKAYQFSLLLNSDWKIVDIKPDVPDEKQNLTSIALFKKSSDPGGEIEVLASLIPKEVNPSDWLEFYLFKKQAKIINGRRFETKFGRIADYLAILEEENSNVILRLISLKDDNKIFTVMCRAYENSYDQLAEDFFMAISSFHILHPTNKIFAEKMQDVLIEHPVRCSFLFPASWHQRKETANTDLLHSESWYNYKQDIAVGIFTFISISKNTESDKTNLLYNYLSNFIEQGMNIESDFEIMPVEKTSDAYQTILQLSDNKDNRYQISCRFLEKKDAIIFFAICSLIDTNEYDIHIINKRSFEIALQTFKAM